MNPEDEISPATIIDVTWAVRGKVANPTDVKALMGYFCDLVEEGKPLPIELRQYLKESFEKFLSGSAKTLDIALGIKSDKRGRPKANEQDRIAMATEILRLRMGGSTHEAALQTTGETFSKESSVLGEAWAKYQQDAYYVIRFERASDKYPWTPEELQRIETIFSGRPWVITPGKDRNKP